MLKIFFITALLFIPFLGFSQTSKKAIDSFMDVPFGSDSATVKSIIIAKGGVLDKPLSYKDHLVFSGLVLSGRKVIFLAVDLVDNKAYAANFAFLDFEQSDVLSYYDSLRGDIAAVYGEGTVKGDLGDLNNFVRIKALKSGSVTFSTTWVAKSKNAIGLTFQKLDQSLCVMLTYIDTTLSDLSASKRRSDL